MRLLFLLPFAPRLDAPHGGARLIAQFLAGMMSRHQLAIVCFRDVGEDGTDDTLLDGCEVVEEVVRPSTRDLTGSARALRRTRSLMRLQPAWVADWESVDFAEKARTVAMGFRPQIIQLEGHVMGQYLPALEGIDAGRLLVQHEPAARAASYFMGLPRLLRWPLAVVERRAWARYESNVYRKVDAIVVFTDADRRVVRRSSGRTPVRVIPPGTVIPDHPLDPRGKPPPALVFVGNFIHPPNIDAARRLTRSIYPEVRRRIPECRLLIVGDAPPQDLKEADDGAVVVTGRVPDVTPFLDEAALFVAPIHLGGGIRIKVIEALAAGKAAVVTPLAIEGLALEGEHVLAVARDDDEFVESVVRLLRDERDRASLAGRARAWAVNHLGWDVPLARFERLYEELVAGDGPDAGETS